MKPEEQSAADIANEAQIECYGYFDYNNQTRQAQLTWPTTVQKTATEYKVWGQQTVIR